MRQAARAHYPKPSHWERRLSLAAFRILGKKYPGLFDRGDTIQLRDMLLRFETDSQFRHKLSDAIESLKVRVSPQSEERAIRKLLDELAT